MRLHTWRLGLTALILKNCHLSPDDLLFTPRASSSSCSSLSGSFNRSTTPTHHLDTLLTVERNCAALHRLEPTSRQTSPLVPWKHPCHDQESTLYESSGNARGLAHLQAVHTNRLGLEVTKWQEYVVGISGKIVWG